MSKIQPLPSSKSNWWLDAKQYKKEMGKRPAHEHFFKIVDREIRCTCNIGYTFTGKEKIVDGKIVI